MVCRPCCNCCLVLYHTRVLSIILFVWTQFCSFVLCEVRKANPKLCCKACPHALTRERPARVVCFIGRPGVEFDTSGVRHPDSPSILCFLCWKACKPQEMKRRGDLRGVNFFTQTFGSLRAVCVSRVLFSRFVEHAQCTIVLTLTRTHYLLCCLRRVSKFSAVIRSNNIVDRGLRCLVTGYSCRASGLLQIAGRLPDRAVRDVRRMLQY